MLSTTPAQPSAANPQLRHSPSEPLAPPPISWKVLWSGRERLSLLAAGAEDHAPPDEEAAERDDERGDPSVGDDVARHRADQGAEHDAHERARRPTRTACPASPPIVTLRPKNAMTPLVCTRAIV